MALLALDSCAPRVDNEQQRRVDVEHDDVAGRLQSTLDGCRDRNGKSSCCPQEKNDFHQNAAVTERKSDE